MKYDVIDISLNIYFFHITPSNLDLVLQDKEKNKKKVRKITRRCAANRKPRKVFVEKGTK
jgi:hypothetical protein